MYCPFNGRFNFIYNVNDGSESTTECPDPVSELDNCPSGSALNLRFRRCSFENRGKFGSCAILLYRNRLGTVPYCFTETGWELSILLYRNRLGTVPYCFTETGWEAVPYCFTETSWEAVPYCFTETSWESVPYCFTERGVLRGPPLVY